MKTRNANRILLTAVMALVLGALLAVSSFAAIGLTEDGLLAGLVTGKTYTAAPYDIVAGTAGTAQSVDKTTDFDTLGAGIWAISDGTTTEYVFVKGAESGQISYWDTTNNAPLAIAGDRNTKGLTIGMWTRGNSGSYKTTPVTVDENGVTVALGTATTQKASLSLTELLYGMTNAQVIPANAFDSFTFSVAFPTDYATGYSAATLDGTVTFYVKNVGDADVTAITAPLTGKDTGSVTIAAPAALKASTGYIVGIGFQPWANWTDGTNLYTGKNQPATIVLNKGVNAFAYTLAYAAPDVEVTGVTLDKDTLALNVGDTYQLTAEVLPANATEKGITWTVEGTAVTAANGNVIAVEAGTATVTVTTVNGKTDSCTVTVTAEPVLPNHEGLGITLAGTIEGLEAGKEYTIQSYDIIANAKGVKAPVDATTIVESGLWYVSNGEKGGYVFVDGEKSGEISFWDVANNKHLGNQTNTPTDTIVPGMWTRSSNGAYTNIGNYANAAKTDTTVCIHIKKDKFLTKVGSDYSGATPKTGADNLLQESVIYYGFTAEQVVPANKVKDITTKSTITQTGALSYNTGKTVNDHKGTFTFVVYNPVTGETTRHTIDTVGEQKVFTAPASMTTSEGYLIGFEFAPYANSADDLFVNNPADPTADTGYVHIGLNAGVNKITLKGASYPAPEGIAVVDGKVTGLVDGKYYQYAPVTLGTGAKLVVGDAVKLDENATPAGFFVVRETNATATNYTAWTSETFFIAGSSPNKILHTEQKTGTGSTHNGKVIDVPVINNISSLTMDNINNTVFASGKWSGFLVNSSLQQNYGFDPLIIGGTSGYLTTECAAYIDAATDDAKEAASKTLTEKLSGLYFTYSYTPDEIIPMANWDSFKFKVSVRQTGAKLNTGKANAKVTLFVVNNGQIEERVAYYDTNFTNQASTTVTTKQADFADNSGYIVGIKIQPYFAPEGTTYIGSSKGSTDINLTLFKDGYTIVLDKEDAPTGLYIQNGVVKGLDANKTYAWAYQYVDSQGVSNRVTGQTEITGLSGLVGIMVAGDGITTNNSDPVLFYIKGSADGRANIGKVEGGKPAFKTAEEWIPGTWTGSYLSWHDQPSAAEKAYAFLDQTAGVTATDARTLWLYQNTKEQAQAKLDADAQLAPPANWAQYNVTSKPSLTQAAIDSHYAAADYDANLAANKAAHQTKIATGFESRYIQYAYDETEIIPVNELIEMSFTSKSRQTDYTFTATPKTVFYVMDLEGTVTEYTAMGLATEFKVGVWQKTTVDVQSIENWPANGYVVAVRFYPLGDVDDASIAHTKTDFRADASNIAYSFTQHHIAAGYYYAPYTGYVIKSDATAPTFEVTANKAGEGYDVTIANYSSAATYEWQKKGDATWTTLDAGVKTFTVAETGTYTVKLYGELILGEAQADVVVDKLTPVAPTLNYAVNSANDFKVTIANASSLYTYEYKAAADSEWTLVEGTSFVATTGTYNVRATGEVWNGYAYADIEVAPVAPVTHKVSVVPGEAADFTVTIKNYSDLYTYEYKLADATEWTQVPAGEASFVITVGGDYVLRAGGPVYDGWAESTFRAVEVPQEIKALTIEGKVLSGLVETVAYEFALVNYEGISETWTAIPAGTEYTFENPGLYAVRLADTETTPLVFNVQGPIAQRGTIINLVTKNYTDGAYWNKDLKQVEALKIASYDDRYNPQFVVGSWSGWHVGDLAYWSQDWLTAIGSSNYVTHASLGAKITDGSMSQAEVKDFVTSFVFNYAYEDGEIIPFADIEKFTVRTGARQGHIYAVGEVFTKFVVYIANDYGEIETRELLRKADYSGVAAKTTHTIKASDFEDTTGYIVAMQVYPFGVVADGTEFKVSGTVGQDYEAKFLDYVITLPRIDAPTTLTFNEDTQLVEGFDLDTEYYYAPYSINGVGETKYFSGEETLALDAGLWGVGIVSADPEFADSLPYIVYVKGAEADRLALGTIGANGFFTTKSGDVWEPGAWSGRDIGVHSTFGTDGLSSLGGHVSGSPYAANLKAAIDAGDAEAEALARQAIVNAAAAVQFKYAFANEEVIPTNEILNLEFKLNRRMGSLSLGDPIAKVTFFVVDKAGNISEHVWEEVTSTTSQRSHNIDILSLLEGVEGYVVALEVNPWAKVNPDAIVLLDANKYNTMAQINITSYTIKLQPAAPELETMEAPTATGLGEIANLNANMTYQYRLVGDADWTTAKEGITSLRLPAGTYEVRVAETRNFTESESVTVTIEAPLPGEERVSLQNETKKIHLPNDFIEVTANYEIDTTSKIWIARLALDNIKAVSPESTITITGDGYKYVVLASDIKTEKAVHYYNLDISFDGESRHDTTYEEVRELAGEAYLVEFFTESVTDLPFESAELYIEVGNEYDGQDVELRSYNERIGKLRKTESASVVDGWVMFTNFGEAYVILKAE